MAPGPVTPVFQIVNSAMSRSEEGIIDEFIIEAKVDDKGRLTQR